MKWLSLIVLSAWLCACTTEPVYRGVPAQAWSQLSGEQKQLIVDQAFQSEIKS